MSEGLFKAFLILSSLVTHSIRGILTALSKNEDGDYDYSTVMATMLTEMLKLFISFIIFRYKVKKDPSIRKSFTFKEIMLWSVPAFLYAIGHNMYYYIMQIVDTPVTVQVFGSLETVIVGVFSVVIMKKRLSGIHWASMLLICDSVASIQLARSTSNSFVDFPFYPAFLTIISTAIVACAGVCIEKLMKSHKDMSIFQQNIWLYLYYFLHGMMASWGAVVNFIFLVGENGYNAIQQITVNNFNFYAIAAVICLVYMGIVTGAILKYLSAVVKAFTSSTALVVTSIISSLVLNVELTLPFYLAVINLSIAIYLYKTAPKPAPIEIKKELPIQVEMEEIPSEVPTLDVKDAIEIGDDEEEIEIRKPASYSCLKQTRKTNSIPSYL